MKLPSTHADVLDALTGTDGFRTVEDVASDLHVNRDTVAGAAFALAEDGLVTVEEGEEVVVALTDEGEEYASEGLPELQLLAAAQDAGADEEPVALDALLGTTELDEEGVQIALSNLARKDYGAIEQGDLQLLETDPDDPEATALELLDSDADATDLDPTLLDALERRNLIERREHAIRRIALTAAGRAAVEDGFEIAETADRLTPELLTSGEWADVEFRPYNVAADPPREIGGSEHVLRRTAERVKDVLVGMGFREMEGPHVDADFWINDVLFMPQDHPARTHWDRFELATPAEIDELPRDLVDRVERAHRDGVGADGEGYRSPWEESVARELALRGHTTSLSARHLAGVALGDLEPPQRFFSVEKVYRNDTLDATHLLEFFQIEGWVMAEALSVRDLKGTFTEFYEHFGITDLEFKPHYNPYTEPSFELFGTHPRTGELIEIGNSGLFRPEMLEPLDVDCDVMAWGLALERLMMLVTGAEDIRDVHGTLVDLAFLRDTEVTY